MKLKLTLSTLIFLLCGQSLMGMKNQSSSAHAALVTSRGEQMAQDNRPITNITHIGDYKESAEAKSTQESSDNSKNESVVDLLKKLMPETGIHAIIFNQAKEWRDETNSAMTFNNALHFTELDNSLAAVTKTDNTIEIWDTKKKKRLKILQGTGMPKHAGDKLLYSFNGNTMAYDIKMDTQETLQGTDVEVLENGFIATTVEKDEAMKIWNLTLPKEKQCVATIPLIKEEKERKEHSEQGENLHSCQHVIALSNGNFAIHNHKTVRIIDPTKTSKEQVIKEYTADDIEECCYAPDCVALQQGDAEFSICNLVTFKEEANLLGEFIELLQDGRFLLTLDDELYLWDTKVADEKQIKMPGDFMRIDGNQLHTRIGLARVHDAHTPHTIEYVWDLSQQIPQAIAAVPLCFGEHLNDNLIDNNVVLFNLNLGANPTVKIINPKNNQTVATLSLPLLLDQHDSDHYVEVLDSGAIMTRHDESNTIRIWEPTKACTLEKANKLENLQKKRALAIEKAKQHFAKFKPFDSAFAQVCVYQDFVAKKNK